MFLILLFELVKADRFCKFTLKKWFLLKFIETMLPSNETVMSSDP